MNPFDKSFEAQYALAIREGNRRFGSECKHEQVYAGRCCNCLRRVLTSRAVDLKPHKRVKAKSRKASSH